MNGDTVVELTAQLVCAFVARNPLPAGELPGLVEAVYRGLEQSAYASPLDSVQDAPPAVRIGKSITDDYLICLDDGRRFKSLKRHLMSAYGLTPEGYREKWGLPDDYPMVAPAYAKSRSDLALRMGFGRKNAARAGARAA